MQYYALYLSPVTCHTKQECLKKISRIQSSFKKATASTNEIIHYTETGHTIRFADSKKAWKEQQLVGIDIDNLTQITVWDLLKKLKQCNLSPFAAFATFSNTDHINPDRLHLYFALDTVITDSCQMQNLIHLLCDIVNALSKGAVDYQCTDPGRKFFPGHCIWSDPKKQIPIVEWMPLANILYEEKPVLVDRIHLLKEMETSFRTGQGIPGVTFSDIPKSTHDFILLGARKDKKTQIVLQSLALTSARVTTMVELLVSYYPDIMHYRSDNYPIAIYLNNRVKEGKYIMCSKAQNSTEPTLYLAKVKNIYQNLFLAYLYNFLMQQYQISPVPFETIKARPDNLSTMLSDFKIGIEKLTKQQLLNNLRDLQNFIMTDFGKEYPYLYRMITAYKRHHILSAILTVVSDQIKKMHKTICCEHNLQYAVTREQVQKTLQKRSCTSRTIRHVLQLCSRLGILSVVAEEHQNRQLYQTPQRSFFKKATVITLSYFDFYLLTSAEERAKHYISRHKTVRSLAKINTKDNDTYLAIKNCVIHLLDKKQYFTKKMLVQLVEEESICRSGKKGEYLVQRYLPHVQKDLRLYKDHCTKFLKERTSDRSLKIGASVVYYQGDLLNHV